MIPQLPPFKTELEPVRESKEEEKPNPLNEVDPPLMVPNSKLELSGLPSGESEEKSFIQLETIPSLDKELATQLWEEVQEKLKA